MENKPMVTKVRRGGEKANQKYEITDTLLDINNL